MADEATTMTGEAVVPAPGDGATAVPASGPATPAASQGGEQPQEPVQQEGSEQQTEPTPAEFVPRAVAEQQMAQMQSAKDKEIAQLRQQLQQHQVPVEPQPHQPEPQTQDGFDNDRFLELMDKDPAQAIEYMRTGVVSSVQQQIQQQMQMQSQQEQALQQYEAEFNQYTNGYSEDELLRAQQAVQTSFEQGKPLSPFEAAAVGRFGSVEAAMSFATNGMTFMQQQAQATQNQNQPTHPPAPGAGVGTAPRQGPPQAQSQAGDLRKMWNV